MTEPSPAGFVAAETVREQLGIAHQTFLRRLRDSGVTVYRNPKNRLYKLLREEDAARMLEPEPVVPKGNGSEVASK